MIAIRRDIFFWRTSTENVNVIEVFPNFWIGDEQDYYGIAGRQAGWAVVHACKEPFHRQALGYSGRAAPKQHPEYLFARRGDRLILNLIDADSPAFVPKEIVDAALAFIHEKLNAGRKGPRALQPGRIARTHARVAVPCGIY